MKGRITYGIVILKSLYCLNVMYMQYIKEGERNTYGIVIYKEKYIGIV